MTFEIDENTGITAVLVTTAIVFGLIVTNCQNKESKTDHEAIKAGLEQQVLEGSSTPRWVKPK